MHIAENTLSSSVHKISLPALIQAHPDSPFSQPSPPDMNINPTTAESQKSKAGSSHQIQSGSGPSHIPSDTDEWMKTVQFSTLSGFREDEHHFCRTVTKSRHTVPFSCCGKQGFGQGQLKWKWEWKIQDYPQHNNTGAKTCIYIL